MLDEIQGTRLPQFFQYFIGVLYSRDLDPDTVVSYLISLSLGAVLFHTSLKLIDCILHIFIGRCLSDSLVRDTHAAFKVKAEIDIARRTHTLGVQSVDRGHSEEYHDSRYHNQAQYASAFFHDFPFLSSALFMFYLHMMLFSRLVGESRFYHDCALYTLTFHLTAYFICIIDCVVEFI